MRCGSRTPTTILLSLGDGSEISFWHDIWLGNTRLCNKFPRLYALESFKSVKVKDRVIAGSSSISFSWGWVSSPRGRSLNELSVLLESLRDVVLSPNCPDRAVWFSDASGSFSVKSLRCKIDSLLLVTSNSHAGTLWLKLLPRKVCVFIWRLNLGRLPVKSTLLDWGVDMDSALCPRCDDVTESLDHCFVGCSRLNNLWNFIFDWWHVTRPAQLSVSDIINFDGSGSGSFSSKTKLLWKAVLWSSLYLIWKSRNDIVFSKSSHNSPSLGYDIQMLSFSWINARLPKDRLSWRDWILDPGLRL